MPRDIERACDATKSAPVMTPDALDDPRPELNMVDRPPEPTPSKVPVIPVDPDLLRFRHRLDQQLVAWRNGRSATSLANALAIVSAPQAPPFEWRTPLIWMASIAACVVAGLAGWWVASAPAVRIGVELAETRQALQQEQDKVQKLGAALAATSRELGDRVAAVADKTAAQDQERDALQQALQQSEAAAANFAQSLAQERDRNQQLEQQLAARHDTLPEFGPSAVEPASVKPPEDTADPDLARLMSRASVLVAQGDIGAARIVLERAAETGSAQALFALAETFDPAVLSAWGTVGTQGNVTRARDLYAKALAGGVAAAKDRLATIRP
jgi:hypothetical protein